MVMEAETDKIADGSQRPQAMRASMSVRGAKDWIKCQPSPGFNTYIADRDFRIW